MCVYYSSSSSYTSEAHNCCDHWVTHWIHTGHLYIDGLKMSKSLKNFISIEEYLSGQWLQQHQGEQQEEQEEGARRRMNPPSLRQDAADDLRIFFLQHKYHSSLHFSTDRMVEAGQWRKKVSNTLSIITSVVEEDERQSVTSSTSSSCQDGAGSTPRPKRMNPSGFALAAELQACQAQVDAALRDDFDTPRALQLLTMLCSKANVHTAGVLGGGEGGGGGEAAWSVAPLPAVQEYVVATLGMFGLCFPAQAALATTTSQVSRAERVARWPPYRLSRSLHESFTCFKENLHSYSILFVVFNCCFHSDFNG